MSAKGNCGGGGGGGGGGGCGGGKVEIPQDSCQPVVPCQNVTPVPAQCKDTPDPCQENQGSIGGGYGGGQGGCGGQGGYGGGGGTKK
ncbi:hypothetical protein GDO81_004303 [Engystomops pustulosus]|uniref:Uncharacterized protein n=1 Tax=Engystomops pustulosus TaxID=76066 RepID=A0AAV6ZTQ4_ENGPU|nr:hypothetical protein GDO81_004303 [Engystomops pustulosus]